MVFELLEAKSSNSPLALTMLMVTSVGRLGAEGSAFIKPISTKPEISCFTLNIGKSVQVCGGVSVNT